MKCKHSNLRFCRLIFLVINELGHVCLYYSLTIHSAPKVCPLYYSLRSTTARRRNTYAFHTSFALSQVYKEFGTDRSSFIPERKRSTSDYWFISIMMQIVSYNGRYKYFGIDISTPNRMNLLPLLKLRTNIEHGCSRSSHILCLLTLPQVLFSFVARGPGNFIVRHLLFPFLLTRGKPRWYSENLKVHAVCETILIPFLYCIQNQIKSTQRRSPPVS